MSNRKNFYHSIESALVLCGAACVLGLMLWSLVAPAAPKYDTLLSQFRDADDLVNGTFAAGDIAAISTTGALYSSGVSIGSVSGGAAKPSPMVAGNLVAATLAGVLYDAGAKIADYLPKTGSFTAGNLLACNLAGQIYDAGAKISSYSLSNHAHSADMISTETNVVANDLVTYYDTGGKSTKSTAVSISAESGLVSDSDSKVPTQKAVHDLAHNYLGRRYLVNRVKASTDNVTTETSIAGDLRFPASGVIKACGAYVDVAGNTNSTVVDVHLNGTTIMATDKINIESASKTSIGAATQPAITTTAYTKDGIFTYEVDSVSSTAPKGLTVWIDLDVTP